MKEDRIWNLIARKLTGEATLPELDELYELLRDDPGMAIKMNAITEF